MGTVNLLAVFDTWKSAAQSFDKASQALGKAADQLCDELTAAGAAWGHDELGQAFFNGGGGKPGFGTSRDEVLPLIGDMVNVLAGSGDALVVAQAVYLDAEQANAQLSGGKASGKAAMPVPPAGGSYRLPPYTGGMTADDPPPGGLEWMMNLVASLVAGCEWPDGSISGLEKISGALSAMATAMGPVIQDVRDASTQVIGSNIGLGPESFGTFSEVVILALEQLQQALKGLASSVDNLVAQKKAAWIQLIASMVFLVASFFVAQALAVWTLGASEAEFFATAEAEGWTLRMLFQLLAKGVLEGLWYGGGMDAVGQVSRIITGAQHGWNWAEFGKAAGEGAVAGAVMSGLSGAARFAGTRSDMVKALFNVMDGKVDNPSAMTKLAGFGARVGLNSATGFAGNLASQAAFDDGNVNLTQAGSFAVGMAVMGEGINLLTPGEHGKAPDGDPPGITDSDVPAAIDDARAPSGVQAALTTTLHDPSASDHSGPGGTDSDDKPPPPPPPPPGGPGGTPTLDDTATSPSATHLASISTTHDQATADSPLTPVTPTPNGDHPGAAPAVVAGHDGPTILADHTSPATPDTLGNGTPGDDARPLEPALSPTETVTPPSPADTGFAPQHPADQAGPTEGTVGSPASSHDALASAGRDPADGGTEIRTSSSEPPAQPRPDSRADFNPPEHAGDGATVPEEAPPASNLAGVGQAPAAVDDSPIPGAHDLTSSAPLDDAGISGADRPPVDLRPASDATSPEDVAGGRMDANDARQIPVAPAEDRPLADGGHAGPWDAPDDAARTDQAANQRDDMLGAGDGRDISGAHSDQETLPDDDLDREFADLVNSDHGGLDRELADLLNSDRSGLALAGSHGGADDVYYSEDGHVGTETPAGDGAPHDDQGLPRDDTSAPTQGHDPARDHTSAPTRDHDPARDDTSPANHGHSPAHDDASARDHGQQVHDSVAPGDHTYPPGTEVVHVDLTGTAFEPPEAHRGLVELGSDYRTEDGEEIPLFKGKPGPEQVAQGGLRNCFAMAVLRSVARTDPDAIADNIWENPDGTITVRLHEPDIVFGGSKLTGRIVEIRMSKELPVYAEDPTRPAYANVRRGGAAWPGYYERALAAINEGGFARLDEGGGGPYISGFLTEITGKPSFYDVDRDPYNAAANWKKLLDAGNPVIVGTKSGLENPKFGLFSPHAYEVVDVVDGHVILKNPHGRNDPEPIPLSEWSDHFTGMWASKLPPDAGQHEAPALSDTAGGDRVATDPARAEPTSARPDTTEAASGDARHPASGGQASAGGPADRTGSPSAQPAHDPATSSHGGDTHSADPARSPGDVTAPIQHPADAGVVPRAPASPAQPVHIPQDPAGPVFRNADPGGGPGFTPHAEVRFGADVGMPGKLDLSPGREILLGRGDESPLRLALRRFDSISRRHATIGADADGTPWIRDEGSTNGTFVNGQQIPAGVKVPLPDGAVVRLGDSTDLHIGGAGIPRAHDPGNVSPAEARTVPAARPAPGAVRPDAAQPGAVRPDAGRPDIAQVNAEQPPHAEVRFGADVGMPGKLDLSPGREVLVGRDERSPLGQALSSFTEVSRRHATIGADADGTPWIRDEGSTNGTFVNGQQIPAGVKVPLPDGAVVRLGDSTDLHIGGAGIQRAHDPVAMSPAEAHTAPIAGAAAEGGRPEAIRAEPTARAVPEAVRPDVAQRIPDQPPPVQVKFGADFGRPGTVDISPGREVLIGRSDDSPLGRNLWPFEEVSRRHATIGADPDGTPWIRDEGSSNGTFVNGERIPAGEKVPLPPGARVRLGSKTEIDVSQGDRDPGNVSPAEAHTPPVARADPAVHPDAARPDPAHAARQDPARPDAAHPDPARPDPARPDAAHAAHPDPARVEHRDFGRAVPRKLRQIVADHPGVLDAPRRLGELKDNLRPGVSFDDMRSLRELSYRLNGVEPPSLSRETFDELLGKVWSQRFSIKNDNGVYREYAVASEENPLTRSYRSYLDEIAGIAQGRTHGTIQAGTGKEAPDSLSPENAADVDPDSVGFVHFHRDYADPNSVSQRVYVNARADSAPALMHAFVHEVVDDPRRFPGIFEAKITGPHGAGRRSDNIVIYTDGEAANQHVISWLKKYQSKHDAFMWSVPPMTEQVMEGVATGAEPLVADRSFGGLRSEAIYQALEESMLHGDDFAGFLNRALGLLPRYYVDSQTPHMNNS